MGNKRKEQPGKSKEVPIEVNDMAILTAKIPTALKDAIGNFASLRKISMASVIVDAVVAYINFDVKSLPKRTRKVIKYASKEERENAYREDKKAERALSRLLVDQYLRNKKLEEADKMERSLEEQRIQNSKKEGK